MKKAWILCFMLSAGAVICQPNLCIVPPDDELYEYVEALHFISGIIPLSSDRPQSIACLRSGISGLSIPDSPATDAITGYLALRLRPDIVIGSPETAISAGAFITPEFYVSLPGSSIENQIGYDERAPIVSFPLDAEIVKAIAIGGIVDLRLNPDAVDKTLYPGNYMNIPSDPGYFDFRIPLRSYLCSGGSFWNARICRETVNWGPSSRNALYLADSAGFLDHLYGELTFPGMSYGLLVASLDSREEGFKGGPPVTDDSNVVPRTFLAHRVNIRLIKRIRLSISEGMMIGGTYPDIRYFNPFFIFHDSFSFDHATSYLGIDMEALPWKYFSLYASAVANQLQSSYETSTYDGANAIPNAFGWQAGAKAHIPLGPGILSPIAEFTYTNPWMYIRETAATSYSNEHYLASNAAGSSQYDFPCLGMKTGPDSILSTVQASYRIPGKLSASLSFDYLIKGEQDLSTPYVASEESSALVTPTGTPEKDFSVSLHCSWQAAPPLGIGLALVYLERQNAGHDPGTADRDIQAAFNLRLDVIELTRLFWNRRN